jgi:enamine deaminase RidA (YjgF/YER057c/UK114 family)
MKKHVIDVKGFESHWGYPGIVRYGDLVFISGLVSISNDGQPLGVGDMKAQITNVYSDLGRALVLCGGSFDNILKETIHTTNIAAFIEHKDVRSGFFSGVSRPASSAWHEVTKLVHPDFLVEVEAIAAIPQKDNTAEV